MEGVRLVLLPEPGMYIARSASARASNRAMPLFADVRLVCCSLVFEDSVVGAGDGVGACEDGCIRILSAAVCGWSAGGAALPKHSCTDSFDPLPRKSLPIRLQPDFCLRGSGLCCGSGSGKMGVSAFG